MELSHVELSHGELSAASCSVTSWPLQVVPSLCGEVVWNYQELGLGFFVYLFNEASIQHYNQLESRCIFAVVFHSCGKPEFFKQGNRVIFTQMDAQYCFFKSLFKLGFQSKQ